MSQRKVQCTERGTKVRPKCQAKLPLQIYSSLFFCEQKRSGDQGRIDGINQVVRTYWAVNYMSRSDRIPKEWQGVYGWKLGRMSIYHHQKNLWRLLPETSAEHRDESSFFKLVWMWILVWLPETKIFTHHPNSIFPFNLVLSIIPFPHYT